MTLRNVWIIARKEYNTYFNTPIAYAMAAALLFAIGVLFAGDVSYTMIFPDFVPSLERVVQIAVAMLIFILPAITMRLLSDEARQGTIELLLTAPVNDGAVVVGKWLGAVLFVLTVLSTTLIYPIMLNGMVQPGLDRGLLIAGYLSLVLFTMAFSALGVAVSAMFDNLVATFIATIASFVVFWYFIGIPSSLASGAVAEVSRYMSFIRYFEAMVGGAIQLTGLVYYLSATAFFLILATVILQSRRWR
jgi:ABC-2 type transport system permease protein